MKTGLFQKSSLAIDRCIISGIDFFNFLWLNPPALKFKKESPMQSLARASEYRDIPSPKIAIITPQSAQQMHHVTLEKQVKLQEAKNGSLENQTAIREILEALACCLASLKENKDMFKNHLVSIVVSVEDRQKIKAVSETYQLYLAQLNKCCEKHGLLVID